MSSPFQKQFSSKSPLHGAYSSGADAMVTVSDAGHFAKLQSDIKGATLAAMEPKVSKCEALRNNWHAGKMTDKAYADASKDCGGTKSKSSKTEQEKGIEKFGQDSYISNKMEGIGDLATATLENELKNK
tara:strand:+ start:481 stop:867 length:387 start_codon:yes stop_codon:yes gene_type:complete